MRIYASLFHKSSVWVLEARKSKSFEYAVNTDSPPPSQYFSQQGPLKLVFVSGMVSMLAYKYDSWYALLI